VYNVILRRVRAITVAVKSNEYYITSVPTCYINSVLPVYVPTLRHYSVVLQNTSVVHAHKYQMCCEGSAVGLKIPEKGFNERQNV